MEKLYMYAGKVSGYSPCDGVRIGEGMNCTCPIPGQPHRSPGLMIPLFASVALYDVYNPGVRDLFQVQNSVYFFKCLRGYMGGGGVQCSPDPNGASSTSQPAAGVTDTKTQPKQPKEYGTEVRSRAHTAAQTALHRGNK